MTEQVAGIRFRKGSTDILIIAPHAAVITNKDGTKKYKNDKYTGLIAEELQNQLGCSTLINDSIIRTVRNYNSIDGATKDKEFIENLRSVLNAKSRTLVVWIHGIGTAGHKSEKEAMKVNGRLDCLIGYGQPDGHTADKKIVEALIGHLRENSIIAFPTRDKASDYRGWTSDNMNQWFRQQKDYNNFSKVQSVQIEFSPYRRGKEKYKSTAKSVSAALDALIRTDPKTKSQTVVAETQRQEANAVAEADSAIPERLPVKVKEAKVAVPTDMKETAADEFLVGEAYEFLEGIFKKHFHNAMLEAGEYIISEFFGGDYEKARNPRNAVKIRSFGELTNRLQENSGHAPSKTWVYDAVKLAIDEHKFNNFRTYGKLGHSHKVLLTHVSEDGTKRQLVKDAAKDKYTVARLREEIKKHKNGHVPKFDHILNSEELAPLDIKELERLQENALNRINYYNNKLEIYSQSLKQVQAIIAEKSSITASEADSSECVPVPPAEV